MRIVSEREGYQHEFDLMKAIEAYFATLIKFISLPVQVKSWSEIDTGKLGSPLRYMVPIWKSIT